MVSVIIGYWILQYRHHFRHLTVRIYTLEA